jgi:DNA-binding NtrC family response regulator
MQTLAYTRGDRSRAAQILGIGRKTLYRKLQKYSVSSPTVSEGYHHEDQQ